uniref:Pre-hexon-linking protein VIII n=1 Tax=Elaeophora elaphi TaxID=1147741 RepID=A0A0R3RM82_9BILA
MIASPKSESVRRDSLVVSAPPHLLQFSIPMLAAFNPFQMKHQIAGARHASGQLTDWFQPLRTNLFRPLTLSNTGALLSPAQIYPMTTNLTHLGDFSKLMDSSNLLLKILRKALQNLPKF